MQNTQLIHNILEYTHNIFVFLYFRNSKWNESSSPCTVTPILSEGCLSMGDAMREIDDKSLIRSDFVLVYGDIVANLDLQSIIQEHKYVKYCHFIVNLWPRGPIFMVFLDTNHKIQCNLNKISNKFINSTKSYQCPCHFLTMHRNLQ